MYDPGFAPVYPAWASYLERARASAPVPLRIALERENGLVSTFEAIAPSKDADPEGTYRLVERAVKFLLWSRGGWRIHFQGPAAIGRSLKAAYAATGARAFDARTMAGVYERPFEVALDSPATFPEPREAVRYPGGYLDGCRIGFDLGASDYKVAAVIDGAAVWSEEIPWSPAGQADPEYHYRMIQDGLKKAAAHLPRVDAIGGSSAGILIRRQIRIASLFRSVPEALFETEVKGLFDRLAREWGVPFEVLNDGEVTALAGRLSLGETGVLGVAMGSSEAAGFLDNEGHIPGWLDELAFASVDLNPAAVVDEWSGDRGVGANYFSQQSVNRLALAAGLSFPAEMKLPERLKEVQAQAAAGRVPAVRVFEQIGAEVLAAEFPATAARVRLHLLDEKSRRVGQAVAAASLPEIPGDPR
jgi:predicted NBD/HSP70 family sugar kinase